MADFFRFIVIPGEGEEEEEEEEEEGDDGDSSSDNIVVVVVVRARGRISRARCNSLRNLRGSVSANVSPGGACACLSRARTSFR